MQAINLFIMLAHHAPVIMLAPFTLFIMRVKYTKSRGLINGLSRFSRNCRYREILSFETSREPEMSETSRRRKIAREGAQVIIIALLPCIKRDIVLPLN